MFLRLLYTIESCWIVLGVYQTHTFPFNSNYTHREKTRKIFLSLDVERKPQRFSKGKTQTFQVGTENPIHTVPPDDSKKRPIGRYKARFILPANANAKRMLTSQIRNEQFAAVELCSTPLRIIAAKGGCDVKFTSNSLRIRIRRKYEPGLSPFDYNLHNRTWRSYTSTPVSVRGW